MTDRAEPGVTPLTEAHDLAAADHAARGHSWPLGQCGSCLERADLVAEARRDHGPRGGYFKDSGYCRRCDERLPCLPLRMADTLDAARATSTPAGLREALAEAATLIETGENRAMATDGPVPHFRDELDDREWRRLWVALAKVRAALQGADR